MIPTPKHGILPESVYEPAEDTFILLDALEQDAEEIRKLDPLICLEIGPGSGVVTSFLGKILESGNQKCILLTTDINRSALSSTIQTASLNKITPSFPFSCIQTDLLSGLEKRLIDMGGIGIGMFNPPYVPTEAEELRETQERGEIGATWAGGHSGMEVTNRLLAILPDILAPNGRFYLVAVSGNEPEEIVRVTNEAKNGLICEIVLRRRAGRELLWVLRFIKRG